MRIFSATRSDLRLTVRHARLVLTLAAALCVTECMPMNAAPISPLPLTAPAVLTFSVIHADRAAHLLHAFYPKAVIRIDSGANAVVVIATPDDLAGMRTVASGIDVKSPTDAIVDSVQLHSAKPDQAVGRLAPLFAHARFSVGPNGTVIVLATTADLAQIKAVLGAMDTPPAAATPKPIYPPQAVRVTQADPRSVARALANSSPNVRVAVAGSNILVSGAADDVTAAKALVAQLDVPPPNISYTEVYRFHFVDAASVADLLRRSFHAIDLSVDANLNAITVFAASAVQQRIANAAGELDAAPAAASNGGTAPGGTVDTDVITLHAAVPAIGGAASTSAADIAQSVSQALSGVAPDLKITVHPNSTRLILTGSAYTLQLARDLIAKLDIAEPLVELDTEVYEVDEGLQKQLGIKVPTAALSTTYSEVTPAAPTGGATAIIGGLQAITRTPLTLAAQLDFLVSQNKARILEDPRITTFSGRTASLRAGETVNILTTTGGGTGTVATTQVQSFQTGVTLDITPVVNADDYVTVTLHPSVNTEAGISTAGVPNIQTRDTTTTVGLHDGETLVVGGLIEDSDSRNVQKIPFLGDLPLIGKLFQDTGVSHTRNELIVTVTPHILKTGMLGGTFGARPLDEPRPATFPTLPPTATLPAFTHPVPRVSPPAQVTVNAATAPPAPAASGSPAPGVSAPAPLPSAFAQTNVYTFGSPPPSNYADPNQPPQISYVQVQPSVVKNGQAVTISAITTTNVVSLAFGPSSMQTQTTLATIGAGKWQSTFNFNAPLQSANGTVTMTLTATTAQGANVSLRIPFTLLSQ